MEEQALGLKKKKKLCGWAVAGAGCKAGLEIAAHTHEDLMPCVLKIPWEFCPSASLEELGTGWRLGSPQGKADNPLLQLRFNARRHKLSSLPLVVLFLVYGWAWHLSLIFVLMYCLQQFPLFPGD